MAKFSLKNSLVASRVDENGLQWYECATYTEVKEYMSSNIERTKGYCLKIQENFVEMGYWLKYTQENKMYEQDGFKSIWEFAQTNYNMSKSAALRLMQMNTEFSIDGNTPIIDERYKDYSKSQLQELLYLTAEQRQDITPAMTVSEIREVKKKNQPDDGMIRAFAQKMLRGRIKKQDYADVKSLKDYLYNNFGKLHDGVCSNELDYSSDPEGIIFNHLSSTPNDKMTWSMLAKRILELYKIDPLTLELPESEVLDGQFAEEVLPILSYTRGNVTDSIPFMNEQDMFIFDNGHKYAALTMKLQKYIAEQINVLDLDKYRVEIRAVKIK